MGNILNVLKGIFNYIPLATCFNLIYGTLLRTFPLNSRFVMAKVAFDKKMVTYPRGSLQHDHLCQWAQNPKQPDVGWASHSYLNFDIQTYGYSFFISTHWRESGNRQKQAMPWGLSGKMPSSKGYRSNCSLQPDLKAQMAAIHGTEEAVQAYFRRK